MRWFRGNLRHGSWLALIALAVNFALSFGHIHAIGQRSARGLIVAALASFEHGKTPRHSDGQADYLCPICIAATAVANGLASAPPALPLQLTETALDRTIEPAHFVVEPPRAAFQSRGPPVS